MRSLLALALVAAACDPVLPPGEDCDVERKDISLPGHCWEEPTCLPETPEEALCGRSYVCEIEQIGGSKAPVCIVAWDCDCLDRVEDECKEVERPGVCELI